jgi:lipopolysaccharide transport system ATP-binding protein
MSTVIKVENISKQYRLGEVGTGALSHDINRWWHKVRGKENPYLKIGEANDRATKGDSDYVWALKDINFEVKQGEVLGIIGRNGAGKSTLLKILSKTTTPTTGNIKIKGRIASLLEVGTGFHPELSGRDNIFLNGAILGMTKSEIKNKFDEIVDFAGVERYIDTPVKRYSSGMYVRLAFGVAAHLEPEILIVDEVLAVGDAEFQKKALGKMKSVSEEGGRTVLFVSHNMAAIENLCPKSLVLENGKISIHNSTQNCINYYYHQNNSNTVLPISQRVDRDGNGKIILHNISVSNAILTGSNISIYLEIQSEKNEDNADIAITFSNEKNGLISTIYNKQVGVKSSLKEGINHIEFVINNFPLNAGIYKLGVWLSTDGNSTSDYIENIFDLEVQQGDFYKTGYLPKTNIHGPVAILSNWR